MFLFEFILCGPLCTSWTWVTPFPGSGRFQLLSLQIFSQALSPSGTTMSTGAPWCCPRDRLTLPISTSLSCSSGALSCSFFPRMPRLVLTHWRTESGLQRLWGCCPPTGRWSQGLGLLAGRAGPWSLAGGPGVLEFILDHLRGVEAVPDSLG